MRDSKDDARAESRTAGRGFPVISPSPGKLSYGSGWFGVKGNGNRHQCGHNWRQKFRYTDRHGAGRIGVRMRYLCSCEAVSHLKRRDATAIRCVIGNSGSTDQLRGHGELPQTGARANEANTRFVTSLGGPPRSLQRSSGTPWLLRQALVSGCVI